jgi:hypothetical protein
MSLNEPQRNFELPPRLQELLSTMYAGRESGMSGPAILDFFRRYSSAIEAYRWDQNWRPSRWKIFEDCLSQFPRERQNVIIQDLIRHPGPMKYGLPDASDVQKVQEWLFNEVLDGESIDRIVVTPYGMEIITRSAISLSLAGNTCLAFP